MKIGKNFRQINWFKVQKNIFLRNRPFAFAIFVCRGVSCSFLGVNTTSPRLHTRDPTKVLYTNNELWCNITVL